MTSRSPANSDRAGINRRRFAATVGAAGLVAGVAPFDVVRAQSGPLKVGVLLPTSGAQASIGQDCKRGADLAPAIFKDLGLPELTMMNADTETNVEVARARAEKLISEGAQLLVGAFDSGQTTAIAQVAEQFCRRDGADESRRALQQVAARRRLSAAAIAVAVATTGHVLVTVSATRDEGERQRYEHGCLQRMPREAQPACFRNARLRHPGRSADSGRVHFGT